MTNLLKRALGPASDYANYVGMTAFVAVLYALKVPLKSIDTRLDLSTRKALENAIAKLARG